jgi:transcriptional regulator with XRE-family HTH domain
MPGIRKIGSVPNPTDVQVGRRIRARRLELAVSQQALGRNLKVQKYESGRNRVSASRLREISTILEVSPSYFFDLYKISDEALFDSIDSFIASKDGMRLLRAVMKIKDEAVRTEIVRFIEVVAISGKYGSG